MDAWWRAANYLSVGQIYLINNPLLREPLRAEHIKPRLLGHWGTTPGLNFVYVHMNRVIRKYGLNAIYVCGPGHGGPGMVANTYLEGTYSEIYPNIPQNEQGMRRLFRQFSFPGGIPSHAAPETPGSINEGGELGYALLHAYGAVFDNPDLLACCMRMARSSTTRICWPAAWWAMGRPRRDRAPPAGTRTNFSIPRATERCCRFSI
jgi:xylulose-5-phosphate/fructose-6-phosphate phosphoketolase